MISYEEITGYFDLSAPWDSTELPDSLFECSVCRAWVIRYSLAWHLEWHKGQVRPDKELSPKEIQQAAKRELGAIRRES